MLKSNTKTDFPTKGFFKKHLYNLFNPLMCPIKCDGRHPGKLDSLPKCLCDKRHKMDIFNIQTGDI